MKRFLFLIPALVAIASVSFVSCSKEQPAAEAPKAEAAPSAPSVDPVEDAANAYFADFPGARIIKEDAFLEKVKAGESMTILDIRSAKDYETSHVRGAVNLPWGPAIADKLSSIPRSGQVYVYCYTGQTAGQAVAVLNVAGIPAQSVRYGFVRGIGKVEGYEDALTSDPAELTGSFSVDPAVQAAVDAYFADLGEPPFKNNIISASDAAAVLEAGEDVQFVDVRSAEDYAAGHIEGAMNIPFGKGMQESFANLPSDKKLIVNCYSGQTAGQTVAILNLLGYDAASINSGMDTPLTGDKGWANEGFPLVK